MKILIASDLHGSALHTRSLVERIETEAPDRIVLLGDLLYHGPRNNLPDEYAPKKVIPLLNNFANSIIAVRGNCDSEVDQMVLDFPCMDTSAQLIDGAYNLTLFFTHGHVISPTTPPLLPQRSVFVSGHTHIKVLDDKTQEREVISDTIKTPPQPLAFLNPGSISLPKDKSHSYALYENGLLTLKTLSGTIVREAML